VTGAILPRHRAVHVTPAATKAAAGAIEHVPIAVVGGLPAALSRLADAGVHVVGLDGAARTSLYDMAGRTGPCAWCWAPRAGACPGWCASAATRSWAIPLLGHLASLNVSAAAALACFEIARKRS
jgi:23S rRNA (guanosine2251-2'-O)-methyltransferase